MSEFGEIEVSVHTAVKSISVSNELLKDWGYLPLTAAEKKAAMARRRRRARKDAKRTDCGAVLHDPGEGLHDIGQCALPAGHAGEHECFLSWPRSGYDRRGDFEEFPVPPEGSA